MPFQARENDGYIENGGDLEESDIEYDHNNGGAGGKRSSGNRNHSRKGKRSTNRPGASGPDQYRYDVLRKYHLSRQSFLYIFKRSFGRIRFFFLLYSLSNYSSDGNYSNKSSLNDSGVVGDQELDNVSVGHRDLQRYQVGVACILKKFNTIFSSYAEILLHKIGFYIFTGIIRQSKWGCRRRHYQL